MTKNILTKPISFRLKSTLYCLIHTRANACDKIITGSQNRFKPSVSDEIAQSIVDEATAQRRHEQAEFVDWRAYVNRPCDKDCECDWHKAGKPQQDADRFMNWIKVTGNSVSQVSS
ncbi:hypothetical protein M8994_19750 [Brucella sp. 21LCYQ03]|nr:hypothetical protein [Brucella sp. 21LCYQ03]